AILPLREKIAGDGAALVEVARGGRLDLLRRDRLYPIRPGFDVGDAAARGQRRAVDARHAGLAVAGEDQAAQEAVSGALQLVLGDAVRGDPGDLRVDCLLDGF